MVHGRRECRPQPTVRRFADDVRRGCVTKPQQDEVPRPAPGHRSVLLGQVFTCTRPATCESRCGAVGELANAARGSPLLEALRDIRGSRASIDRGHHARGGGSCACPRRREVSCRRPRASDRDRSLVIARADRDRASTRAVFLRRRRRCGVDRRSAAPGKQLGVAPGSGGLHEHDRPAGEGRAAARARCRSRR